MITVTEATASAGAPQRPPGAAVRTTSTADVRTALDISDSAYKASGGRNGGVPLAATGAGAGPGAAPGAIADPGTVPGGTTTGEGARTRAEPDAVERRPGIPYDEAGRQLENGRVAASGNTRRDPLDAAAKYPDTMGVDAE